MSRSVVITGGSKCIGAQLVRAFFADGYKVILCYKNSADLARELEAQLPGVISIQADISSEADVNMLYEKCEKAFGKIDVLVCNAGVSHTSLLTDTTSQRWDEIFNVNARGTFLTCKAFLPHMIRNKSGSIITVSSIWGITGASCEVAYSASKAAVIGFTKALAKEVGPSNIRVNCVAPGVIETDMNSFLNEEEKAGLCEQTPLRTIGTTQQVADTVLYLASDKSSFITGQVISPNGGIVI